MEHILDLAKRHCEQAEVFRLWRHDTPAQFEANRLKSLQTKESSGTALRIVKNGRIGFSATNDPDDIEGLVERAVELSKIGTQAKFDMPGADNYLDIDLFDPLVEQTQVEQMVEIGQSMIDIVRRTNTELLCDARVSKTVATIEILNSNGGYVSYRKSMFGASVEGTLIRGTDMLFVGEHMTSSSPISETLTITNTVIEQLDLAQKTVAAPSGAIPVIFAPHGVASALIMPLAIAFNGRTVLQGASPLVGKLGKKLFDPGLSIWDDPTINLQPGSRPADDEGIPSRRTAMVERGEAQAFLYDLQTAGLASTESTGSASRGLASLPAPSTSVLMVEPGTTNYADMIHSVKDGLIVEQLLGAGQGNVLGGEFGGNVLLGFRIRDGQIVGRVKDTVISGNVYDALSSVVIGNSPKWVGGSLHTPPILCNAISVSSKS